MCQGFTLIELMIVIAIIAIIAAIAIPNLLESRVIANEAAAAASLKSGIYAAQVQFQSSAYSDVDGDGRGEYAGDLRWLAGAAQVSAITTPVATDVGTNFTTRSLTLISQAFNVADGTAIGPYKFQLDISVDPTSGISGGSNNYCWNESFWSGYAAPSNPGNDGRRAFAIALGGIVYATKATVNNSSLILGVVAPTGGGYIFTTDPTASNPSVNSSNAVPFQK